MDSDRQTGPTLNGNCDPTADGPNPTQTKSPNYGKLMMETIPSDVPDSSLGLHSEQRALRGQHFDAIGGHRHTNLNNGWPLADDQMDSETNHTSGDVVGNEDTIADSVQPLALPNGDCNAISDESSLMECQPSDDEVVNGSQMDIELKNNEHNNEIGAQLVPKDDFRVDFTETEEFITVFLFIKNVSMVEVDFFHTSLEVRFRIKDIADSSTTYVWRKDLHGKIYPDHCSHTLTAMKIELKLKKVPTTFRWNRLEPSSPADESTTSTDSLIRPSQLPSKKVAVTDWQPVVQSSDQSESSGLKPCDPSTSSKGKEIVLLGESSSMAEPKRPVIQKLIGFTGLQNLGNTCFMNSVIQCLSNTDPFRDYFTSDQYLSDINTTNPLGSGGVIAKVFADTLKQLWAGTERSIAPHKLKDKMGDRCPTFSNYLQQDAQEFCVFFLDALHEDLNIIKERPAVTDDKNEDSNEPIDDQILADKAWHTYGRMNRSIVTENFYGQYKSKLVCPVCKKVSVTFDPFVYLSLPLPKPKTEYEVYFFKREPNGMCSSRPKKYTVKLAKDAAVHHLLDEMSKLTGVSTSSMRCVQSKPNGSVEKFLQPKWLLSKPEIGKYLLIFELMAPKPEANEEVSEFVVIQRLCQPVRGDNCSNCDKNASWDNVELKACQTCFRAFYCDKECQAQHWSGHRKDCTYRAETFAVPFVISVAKEALTYRNLCAITFSYARHSTKLRANLPLNLNEFPIPPPFTLKVYRDVNMANNEEPIEPNSGNSDDRYDTPLNISQYYIAMDWINDKFFGENWAEVEALMGISSDTDFSAMSESSEEIDLEDCLQLHTQPEKLTADNPWYCPKCKEPREATKQITLWRLPHFLVIQLKRFSFRNILWREKLDSMVRYPIEGLDMSPFYVRTDPNPDLAPIYDLYGVVNHYGGLFGGHYIAYAKTSNNFRNLGWRSFDDSHVDTLDTDHVVSRSAYMLFYKLRDL